MLLEKSPIYIVFIVCLMSIYALFNIKENVMSIKGELTEVNNQVQDEIDKIHLLKAELAYLASPERLKALNDEYVKLSDTNLAQMEIDPIIQDKEVLEVRRVASVKLRSENTKWRYKKGPSKYVTMASGKK
ncbi:hypothetical protein Megvenef_00841 [Candidatus Megaera venefica]|jgi:hypothetical protein|uniref:Cell division protein FtsL n=1 Tax=Candidatus Megaera venefica TaxID=2055910 RepID=A0ABU5NCK3_9RICK|nr:hypothetical protein [Candidatus Megaera venefica]MEA0970872.1 hypothetical protein [Candidatus Megaera venefica]